MLFRSGASSADGAKSLVSKEKLLQLLLENEQSSLVVWVHPLNESHKSYAHAHLLHHNAKPAVLEVRILAFPRPLGCFQH